MISVSQKTDDMIGTSEPCAADHTTLAPGVGSNETVNRLGNLSSCKDNIEESKAGVRKGFRQYVEIIDVE